MTEREQIRFLDAGRLQLGFHPLTQSESYDAIASKKFKLSDHGNFHGISVFASDKGFVVTKYEKLEEQCKDYIERRQITIDHNQNSTHVEIKPLTPYKEIKLSSQVYFTSLSRDEKYIAVAYGTNVAVFDAAKIMYSANAKPYRTFSNISAQELNWSRQGSSDVPELGVVTTNETILLLDAVSGTTREVPTDTSAKSFSWSPTGDSFAVGLGSGQVFTFGCEELETRRIIDKPEVCDGDYQVHHINWAEEELLLVGYKMESTDDEDEEEIVQVCLFEGKNCLEFDEVVGVGAINEGLIGRKHQFYSCFLEEWRMFFIGCSLSSDIELLVSDPDTGEWDIWEPPEKYKARLPINPEDEEDTYLVGLNIVLNSSIEHHVDDNLYPPVPVLACPTTDGLLINFAFIDLTVFEELEFLKKPIVYEEAGEIEDSTIESVTESVWEEAQPSAGPRATTTDVENVMADEDSDDEDEAEAIEEERQAALEAFESVSSTGYITFEEFAQVFEEIGTTYCEEAHSLFAKKLLDNGKIEKEEFADWYSKWVILGDDEEDGELDNEVTVSASSGASSIGTNLLDKFKMKEGTWKCDVCMVHNPDPKAAKCASCESPNPTFKGTMPPATTGFSFDSAASGKAPTPQAVTAPSFSFGFTAPTSSTTSSAPSFGFSFKKEGEKSAPGGFTGLSFPSSSSSDAATTASTPSVGFQFKPQESKVSVQQPNEEKAEEKYGQNDENTFAESDGEDVDEEAERQECIVEAEEGFTSVAEENSDSIPSSKFEKLFEALGTVYCEEEHSKTLKKLAKDGKVYKNDFVQWYADWVLSTEESDEEDEEEAEQDTSSKPTMKSQAEIAAAFAKFTPSSDSWKCETCLVTNQDKNAQKCASCETPNPNAPKTTGTGFAGFDSGRAKGFSFASASTTTSTTGVPFGFTPSSDSKDTATGSATSKATGFSFGFTNGDLKPTGEFSFPSITESGIKKPSGFSFPTSKLNPTPASSGAYPPDTSAKPKPPAFGGASASSSANPPDTSAKPNPPSGAYPPDTSAKPKPPAFGAAAASSGAYPPDTSAKPKPPAFGAAAASSGAYPPDTSAKPKPPAFGGAAASSGAYPPDTSAKPKPPGFGAAPASSGAYPPDTSAKPKPQVFGAVSSDNGVKKETSTSSFSFGGFGNSLKTDTSASTIKASPFGVVPNGETKSSFSLTSGPGIAPPKSEMIVGTLEKKQPELATDGSKSAKSIPSSVLEGQLWKLIIEFDQSFQRVKESTSKVKSQDPDFLNDFEKNLKKLREKLSVLTEFTTKMDLERENVEKNVLFVIGSDGDVHEQIEFAREILTSFENEHLKLSLEEQALDQRSQETRELLRKKLDEIQRSCKDLEKHLGVLKSGQENLRPNIPPTSHLFRVLKQTYENSKDQYNIANELSEQVNKLKLNADKKTVKASEESSFNLNLQDLDLNVESKSFFIDAIKKSESNTKNIRQTFLALCNNVVTPREVTTTPRRRNKPVVSPSRSEQLNKAWNRLMPSTQVTVASPMTAVRDTSSSIGFKGTTVKAGSNLFPKKPLEEEAHPKKSAFAPATTSLERPSIGRPNLLAVGEKKQEEKRENKPLFGAKLGLDLSEKEDEGKARKKSTSSGFNFGSVTSSKSAEGESGFSFGGLSTPTTKAKEDQVKQASAKTAGPATTTKTLDFSGFGTPSALGKTEAKVESKPSFGSFTSKPNYKDLLTKFYQEFNPGKVAELEKTLKTFEGKEEEMFVRLFAKYGKAPVSDDDVRNFLKTGVLPIVKPAGGGATTGFVSANQREKPSLFGQKPTSSFETKPTAAVPSSPFGNAAAFASQIKPSNGVHAFGSSAKSGTSVVATSAFGQPAVDYRGRLIEFYQKHNPSKLNDVDSTLQKYKGQEEKLFQNLAIKYKVSSITSSAPATTGAFGSPKVSAAPAASPFGNVSAFAPKSTGTPTAFGAPSSLGSFGCTGAGTSGFGSATTQQTPPFGSASALGSGNGFGGAQPASTGFGTPSGGFGAVMMGGNHRERLIQFYTQYNPEKLKDVDSTLAKYQGREATLFDMLEKKYVNQAGAAPGFGSAGTASGVFGFGQAAALGGATGAPAFGAASQLGGGASKPAFGAASSLGGSVAPAFGAPSAFGASGSSSFGAPSSFASGSGSGFASFGAQTVNTGGGSGFGSFSSQGASFGAAAQSSTGGGFGGFGDASNAGGFGQPASFSNPSFTQMR